MITPESLYEKDKTVFKEDDWYIVQEGDPSISNTSGWWTLHVCNPDTSINMIDIEEASENVCYHLYPISICDRCHKPTPEPITTLMVLLSGKTLEHV